MSKYICKATSCRIGALQLKTMSMVSAGWSACGHMFCLGHESERNFAVAWRIGIVNPTFPQMGAFQSKKSLDTLILGYIVSIAHTDFLRLWAYVVGGVVACSHFAACSCARRRNSEDTLTTSIINKTPSCSISLRPWKLKPDKERFQINANHKKKVEELSKRHRYVYHARRCFTADLAI